jgi:hypothetical protein
MVHGRHDSHSYRTVPRHLCLTSASFICRSVIEVRNGKTFLDLIVEQIEVGALGRSQQRCNATGFYVLCIVALIQSAAQGLLSA